MTVTTAATAAAAPATESVLTVRADSPGASRGRLNGPTGELPCALGRAGVTTRKREGDGATPAGRFPLRRVLYRPDRVGMPRTALAVRPLKPLDGWCDDPRDPAYNAHVALPHAGSHEALWRADGLYDLLCVLGYNDDPPVPGRGSAIFLHVARPDWGPTEGCVALARDDLVRLLAACGPDTVLEVEAP